MEATAFRVTHDEVVESEVGRCHVRAFGEVRVVVLTEVVGSTIGLAMAVEQQLDARFFGSSWRLVEESEDGYLLVTFAGYDGAGALVRPDWQPVPSAMGWVRDALQPRP